MDGLLEGIGASIVVILSIAGICLSLDQAMGWVKEWLIDIVAEGVRKANEEEGE